MLKKILGVVGVLIVALVALGFVLPDRVTMERSIVIDAPPEKVFALVGDFNEWEKWSPWAKLDPNAQMTIDGSGVGQTMRWTSEDPSVGSGVQTITAYAPPSRVESRLDFGDMGKADAVMRVEPDGAGTRVTWGFASNMREGVPIWMQPMSTYMGFFMDGLLGPQYEQGLQNLKAAAEA